MSDASADAPGICGDGPVLDVGRETCGRLDTAEPREWLCANGIGGFASGSVAGLLTVNALWYNALRAMSSLARVAGRHDATWDQMAGRAAAGFDRFWSEAAGACHDLIEGDAPCAPRCAIAQAWSVAETLRAWCGISAASGCPA
jgi:glycogen debranching enzyme